MKLDREHLWILTDAMDRDAMIVRSDHAVDHERELKLISGEYTPPGPVTYRHYMRSKPKDLMATTFVGRYLLSDRVVKELRDSRFTGWKMYPVIVTGKTGERIRGYNGLSITGRCGPPDESRYLKRVDDPDGLGYELTGLFFDESTWDGSDVFLVDTTAYICVTDAVRQSITAIGATNIHFERLDNIVMPIIPG